MAKCTLELSDECERRLGVLVAEYNLRTGTALTLAGWVQLHLRELAVAKELAASGAAIREQVDERAREDVAAALNAERERLLGLV